MSYDKLLACFVDCITFWTMQFNIHVLEYLPDHPRQLMGLVN